MERAQHAGSTNLPGYPINTKHVYRKVSREPNKLLSKSTDIRIGVTQTEKQIQK